MLLACTICAHSPAAAAGSRAAFFVTSEAGLAVSLAIGLRLRLGSDFLEGGDLERLSNRDARFGSGSVWSNRERFTVRRSVSSIIVYVEG